MYKEKGRIFVHRVVWLIILAVCILTALVAGNLPEQSEKEMKLKRMNFQLVNYNESRNSSYCKVELVFNMEVDLESATVRFYDEEGWFLGDKTESFDGSGEEFYKYFTIEGKAKSCKVVDFIATPLESEEISVGEQLDREATALIVLVVCLYAGGFALVMLIWALFLSCKRYKYKGQDIIVYAGFFHHYIKVAGRKMDEHNTIITFTAIPLSCTLNDGTHLAVCISLMNRIALKINDQLYRG